MAINSYFFNAVQSGGTYDRIYNAEDFSSYLNQLVGNGVFPNPSSQLKVVASTGMNVVVGAGSGWINGHKMVNTADLTLTVGASDVLLNRMDAVVMYLDLDTRTMGVEVKQGTPTASTPTAPALVRTSTRYELCLATVLVAKQTSAITTSMITDTRTNGSLCGIVQGLIQQIDTTDLWQQQQEAFNEWFESVQQQFQEGKQFKKLEAVHAVVGGQNVYDITDYIPTYSYLYDILELYVNGLHLTANEYTQDGSTVTITKHLQWAGDVLDIVVYQSVDPDAN